MSSSPPGGDPAKPSFAEENALRIASESLSHYDQASDTYHCSYGPPVPAVTVHDAERGLLVRVDPDATDRLATRAHVQPFVMRGRSMDGWLRVETDGVRTKRQLEAWVKRGVAYARSLPPKR